MSGPIPGTGSGRSICHLRGREQASRTYAPIASHRAFKPHRWWPDLISNKNKRLWYAPKSPPIGGDGRTPTSLHIRETLCVTHGMRAATGSEYLVVSRGGGAWLTSLVHDFKLTLRNLPPILSRRSPPRRKW